MNKTIIIIWERQIRASLRSRDHLHRARSKSKMKFQDVGVHRRYRMSLCSVSSYSLSLSLFLFSILCSPSLEASCHRGQCDTSPFRPVSVAVQSLSTAQCPFSRFTGWKPYRSSNGRQPSVIEHPIEKNSTWRKIRLASGHHF